MSKYGAQLPDSEDGSPYVPPSSVLIAEPVSKLRFSDLIARGEVTVPGGNPGRMRALQQRQAIVSLVDPDKWYAPAFAQSLALLMTEMSHRNLTWQEAQNEPVPDPVAAQKWLTAYLVIEEQAQQSWLRFVDLQHQADTIVADWYGFDAAMQSAIAEGLPWARRQRPSTPTTPTPQEPSAATDVTAPE